MINQNHDEMLQLEADMATIGKNYASWKSQAAHLERMRKRILAEIMIEYIDRPVNERDMRARADGRYLTHLEGQKEAELKSNKYYAQWETVKAKIEIRRSINATTRSQMNLQ